MSAMSLAPRQLVLALDHAESFAREDFLAGPPNAAALALIDRWPDWPAPVMALAGPEGSGKTHLASIWAEASGARVLSAKLLGQTDLPGALATGALVVEDLEPEGLDERALFHLLNLAREQDAFVLLTARTAPAGFAVVIRDLASRLRSIPAVTLAPPDDALLRSLIVKLAADRQLAVDEALVNFLVHRIERSFAAARAAVALIDREAMRLHRPATRALAAELFRENP
jgi:chromosomal replication initiation ATPase DnaA